LWRRDALACKLALHARRDGEVQLGCHRDRRRVSRRRLLVASCGSNLILTILQPQPDFPLDQLSDFLKLTELLPLAFLLVLEFTKLNLKLLKLQKVGQKLKL
jgi:hypothetical protein